MATAAQFTIVITALDKSAATLRQVNQRVTGMVSPFAQVGRSIAALGEAAGVGKLAAAAENAGAKFSALGSKISGLLGPIAALGTAASAAGLFEIAKGAADWGHQLFLSSQKTGIAVDQLAKLHYVGQTVELDAARMDKALYKLNLTINDAASGQNKKAAGMFRAFGIPLRDNAHHLRSVTAIWGDLSEAMRRNVPLQQKIAATAFGVRFGEDMIPALLKTRKETTALFGTFDKMYGKITPATVKAAYEAEEGWKRFTLSIQGVKFAIGSALFPAMEKLTGPLTQWIAANRVLIGQRVGEWAKQAGDYLAKIDWQGIGNAALGFARAVGTVGRVLGPVWSTVAIAGIVFSPFIAATLSAGVALAKFGIQLGLVGARVVLFAAAELPSLFLGFATLTSTVLPSLSAAFLAMGAAIEATPIGWIITGIAAVAAAGYLIYRYWTPIKHFFGGVWDSIAGAFRPALPFFKGLWSGVVGTFRWARNFAIGAWDYAVPALTDAWSAVTGFFQNIWSDVTGAFRFAWSKISPLVHFIGDTATGILKAAWSPMKAVFQGIWNGITAVFETAWAILKPIINAVVGGAKWLAEHTGLLDAAHAVAQVTTTVVHKIVHVAENVGAGISAIQEHGAAIVRLGSAHILADLIARGEGNYRSVNLGQRGGYRAAQVPLDTMSLGQVLAAQGKHLFNAAGRYQLIPATLKAAVSSLHLNLSDKFDATMQDRIFRQYLIGTRHPEIANFLSGRSGDVMKAARAAALEWASVADPRTGRSHYEGIGRNHASITVAQMVRALQAARGALDAPRIPVSPRHPEVIAVTAHHGDLSRPVVDRSVLSQPVIDRRGRGGGDHRGPTDGKVTVDVNVKAPQGTRVAANASGRNPPDLEVGRAWGH